MFYSKNVSDVLQILITEVFATKLPATLWILVLIAGAIGKVSEGVWLARPV